MLTSAPHRPALVALIVVAAVYLAIIALQAEREPLFWSPDEGAKYVQLTHLQSRFAIPYPGLADDPDMRYVPFLSRQSLVLNVRLYLQWPVFLPLLVWLPWKLLGSVGLYVVPAAAGLLTLWLTYLLTRRLLADDERARAWLVVPLLGLTTPLFFYSTVYFEHTLACALVVLAFYALVRAWDMGGVGARFSTPSLGWLFLSGLSMAVAIWLRSELYILAGLLVLFVALSAVPFSFESVLSKRRRITDPQLRTDALNPKSPVTPPTSSTTIWDMRNKVVAFGGGLLLGLLPLWGFYLLTWGTLLPQHATPYLSDGKGGLPPARFISEGGVRTFLGTFLLGPRDDLAPTPDLGPQLDSPLRNLFLLALGLFLLGCVLRVGRLRMILLLLGLATTTAISGFVMFSNQPYTTLHGFLLPAPALMLAALAMPIRHRRTSPDPAPVHFSLFTFHFSLTAAYIAAHTLIISLLSGLGPSSQVEWGQRYLLSAYPLVTVLTVVGLPRLCLGGGRWERWLLGAVLAVSLLVGAGLEVRGVLAAAEVRAETQAWRTLVRAEVPADAPLLTTEWWLPLRLNLYDERRLHLAERGEIGDWSATLRQGGRREFYLLTTDPQPPELAGARFVAEVGQAGSVVLRRYVVE